MDATGNKNLVPILAYTFTCKALLVRSRTKNFADLAQTLSGTKIQLSKTSLYLLVSDDQCWPGSF